MTRRPSTPSPKRPVPPSNRVALVTLLLGSLLGGAALVGCTTDEEVTYEQFNADTDTLDIEVGSADLLDAVSTDLHSTTGQVVIGTATVDPGGGPIGTEHAIVVEIADEYENMVDRVSLRTDSGARGEDEYDLDPDSADEGYYKLSLQSVGEEGEVRTDTLTIRVWDVVDDSDGDTASSGDTGS